MSFAETPFTERFDCFGVERPTWPFSAATCRRGWASGTPHHSVRSGRSALRRVGRPPQRAGDLFTRAAIASFRLSRRRLPYQTPNARNCFVAVPAQSRLAAGLAGLG